MPRLLPPEWRLIVLRKPSGASMVEYIILVTLVVGLVGAALLTLINTIWGKLEDVNVQIGS